MNRIKFDENNIIKKINQGVESNIYLYETNKKDKVALKIYKDKVIFGNIFNINNTVFPMTDEILKNKEKKLELLEKESILKDEKPIDLVYNDDGKFVGYTRKIKKVQTFSDYSYKSKKTKIELLKKLKEKMELLNKNQIYIGDYNDSNFYLEDNEVKFFDTDSFHVKGFDFDFKNCFLNDYESHNDKINNIDNYCFNYFTIAFYENMLLPYVKNHLVYNGLPFIFNTKENRKTLSYLLKCNVNNEYLLDHRKKGLFN